ncbi:DEAD/DEAH box helicase [Thermoplasma sp. Kam2015]|uniref:DEAD/DEAH box helicase n=1 Tax=Thermoplasma sp. Kam2015 TaxID=2094122 RepID=UPI001F195478|nr:DEAD/DEAH box helicase [Thermoplasma sp. Kam2015]
MVGIDMSKFEDCNINDDLKADLERIGFVEMTAVQEQAMSPALDGKDLIIRSKTGSGKTAAYLVPILNMIGRGRKPRALVVLPTRELAIQVNGVAERLGRRSRIRSTVIYGGSSMSRQIESLEKGTDIIVGTPGRILDLHDRGFLDLSAIRYFVLDEADVMLDMGFIDDIRKIMSFLNEEKQTFILSATMPEEIVEMASDFMHDPTTIMVDSDEVTVKEIDHYYTITKRNRKLQALQNYLKTYGPQKTIIFSRTKAGTKMVCDFLLNKGYNAVMINGDMSQSQREKAMYLFRNRVEYLVATNVAARGIDIRDVTDIINFDLPDDPKVYVHRVGRTARLGSDGRAFSIVEENQKDAVRQIERMARVSLRQIRMQD